MPFTIIAENCTGCSACEKRCPTGAISGLSKKVYYIEAAMCIDCGACGVICPDDAIMNNHGEITHVLKRAERPVAVVHPDNCNGCGVCVDVCPSIASRRRPKTRPCILAKCRSMRRLASDACSAKRFADGTEFTSCRPDRRRRS